MRGRSSVMGVAAAVVAGAVVFLSAGRAQGMVIRITLSSIEQRVGDADLVVRGRFRPFVPGDDLWTVDVAEVIKGAARPVVVTVRPQGFVRGSVLDLLGVDCVFCLRDSWPDEKGGTHATLADSFFGPWRLDGKEETAYRMDGRRITDGAALLAYVRAAAAVPPVHNVDAPNSALLEPSGFPANSDMRRLTSALLVPVDGRSERIARAWATDAEARVRAVGAGLLRDFKSPENLRMIRWLQSDEAYTVSEESRVWQADLARRAVRVFRVRRSAAETLTSWGMDRDGRATTVTAPHLTYGLVPWRKALFALLGVCAAGAILRRRHASGLAVAAQWGLAMMAVGVAVLAWRSGRGCDLVNWATSGGDYELASAGGRVSLIRVTDGAAARGLAGKSTPFAFGEGRQPWYVPMLAPTAEAGRWGVASSTGVVSGESKAYAYRRYEVSHGALVGLLMVVPVVVWVAGAGRRVRRWWRRRAGRCGACGYDVRSAGGRCSECGAVGLRVSARVSMSFGERTSTHAHVRDGELRANAS